MAQDADGAIRADDGRLQRIRDRDFHQVGVPGKHFIRRRDMPVTAVAAAFDFELAVADVTEAQLGGCLRCPARRPAVFIIDDWDIFPDQAHGSPFMPSRCVSVLVLRHDSGYLAGSGAGGGQPGITGRYTFATAMNNVSLYSPCMDVGSAGDAFRVVMTQTGWSGKRLAREMGASQPWVSMVLNGQRDPGMGRAAQLLARTGWAFQLVPSGDEDPVKRRAFLLTAAGTAASVALPLAQTANPYRDASYVDALTARLVYNEDQMGGTPLAREAMRHATRVISAARDGGTVLQAASSRLCRQASLILYDARRIHDAEKTARTALSLGRSAADATAQARAYDTLSLITAYIVGGKGMEYARLGLAVPDISVADQAVLAARLGRAAALADEPYRARGSLEHALELAGQAPPSAEITGNIGIGFTDLGMAARAGEYLDTAVSLSASSPFVSALYTARQVKATVRARKPDQAALEMTRLTALAPLVQSPRLGFHLRHIYDGTQKWSALPDIRDARDALREVMA